MSVYVLSVSSCGQDTGSRRSVRKGETLEQLSTLYCIYKGAKTATTLGPYSVSAVAKVAALKEAEHIASTAGAEAIISGLGTTSVSSSVVTSTATTAVTSQSAAFGLGTVGTTLGVGLGGAVIAGASWMGSYYLAAKGKIKTAFAVGGVGGAAGGAMLGAAFGSVVPGVGTAIGAGVGAVVGGGIGLVSAWVGSSEYKSQQKALQNNYYYNF